MRQTLRTGWGWHGGCVLLLLAMLGVARGQPGAAVSRRGDPRVTETEASASLDGVYARIARSAREGMPAVLQVHVKVRRGCSCTGARLPKFARLGLTPMPKGRGGPTSGSVVRL